MKHGNRKTDALRVMDRLVVGPVSLEKDRLSAPYTVHSKGRSSTAALSYKYEEAVFEPSEAASRNLASLIAAQVALNYGLFCREIVFKGSFDEHDRAFLEEMAENTAREILVNKIYMENPFLTEGARNLPVEKSKRYLRAALVFEGEHKGARDAKWSRDESGHGVLSSGGKDSLLTHCLLDEIGLKTHPVFVNESGRHWHTALNAYRHFEKNVKRTARVWTNSDRLFSWMLRQLPIVRPDFASLRSDAYPIRLWTVAVFLFGALPILRKRGVGRLIVGDEFDTTIRPRFKGIPHFGGLFDQSRFFDGALTRLFRRKGFDLSVFSVLRPLSELLIQKILVERYPMMQAHQVSCHATHLHEGRALPCGRCEKCRRIVGMLKAFGNDPTLCGYTVDQIESILKALPIHALHQESVGAEHMLHLLVERGLVDAGASKDFKARPHPEVLSLRFDDAHSPVDAIPEDLRAPLYGIMLEHANGALRWSGGTWNRFDPLA